MHDSVTGETIGVASVGVMTDKFVSAAELMAQVLGADGHRFVVIPHPISSATPGELEAIARAAAQDCNTVLTASSQATCP